MSASLEPHGRQSGPAELILNCCVDTGRGSRAAVLLQHIPISSIGGGKDDSVDSGMARLGHSADCIVK